MKRGGLGEGGCRKGAHSKLSSFPTYTGGPPKDPLQVEGGSRVAGDRLEVSTVGLGGNFELLIQSPHPLIFYFWGLTSSICCQIFTACGGHIELMFPPTCACARLRACLRVRLHAQTEIGPFFPYKF